ncbi:MAG TPA: GNAT family N-acetyltransferase [Gemmatimonadaceae bacterium]|nr:GNAT family N-acetyltransferase [Gemmatimonadaceae bacterium]
MRDLVAARFGAVPFADGPLEAMSAALRADTREVRALVAELEGEIGGVAVFGMVAGTQRTAKLHLVVVTSTSRQHKLASHLCEAAVQELARLGARLVVVEMPDAPMFDAGRSLLERCGWREEARVPDFYADGVAMVLLRRESGPGETP